MEVPGRKESSDDKVKRKCQPCQDENVLHEAYGYCTTCGEYLCDACYKYHLRPKPFKDHVLIEYKTITSKDRAPTPPGSYKHNVFDDQVLQQGENGDKCMTEEPPPPVPRRTRVYSTKCSLHPLDDLKYRCKTHKVIVCSECALKKHRHCDNLDNIHDIYDSESERIVSKIQYVEDKAAYILKQETNANEGADVSYEEVLSQIRLDREQVNTYLYETEKRLNNEVYRFREESKNRQTEMLDICQKLKKKKDLIKDTNLSEIERYISMTEGECEIDNINRDLKGVFGLPRLRVSYKSQYPLLDSKNLVVEKHKREIGRRELKLLKKVNIARGNQTCSITDIATPSNETFPVILVDFRNQKLIMISVEYSLIYHQLEWIPWGITFISYDRPNGEIAITCSYDDRILFFTIGQKIAKIAESKRTSIKVESPRGIRYHKSENVMIVAVNNFQNASIQCWSLNGDLVRTIASFGYCIESINLTHDNQIIFGSLSKHCIQSCDMSGKVLRYFPYIDDSMCGPYGIASDQSQSIYVCGFKCLRVVSREGEWNELLTRDDGFKPQSLLVSNRSDRLYVAQEKGCTDLLIFEL
ncbi:uncharacterized protein LOC132750492 [Ruditapes philippinarum]|uniref:uncharacterized protein LOC132750492 n=1 Tax=Ruditapes philippinarum TaxID=129788 RepID=UPI00295B0D6D|nr:uncharacterized protein LOC132750492 [Ruditapes philippinarum]XP_060596470.1 uncharacterized protein LOC132750492 [Ruditapes philippinarum]